MRAVAAILYILVLCSSLGIRGGALKDYPSISYDLRMPSGEEVYRRFLALLRLGLKQTRDPTRNIPPVLPHEDSVPVGERFLPATLHVEGGNVTFAIDVVNLNVVAFSSANDKSYFFKDATQLQKDNLFVQTTQITLPFAGDFNSLENEAGVARNSIPLGFDLLGDAILKLWNGESVAESLIVVIQMSLEAAKFRYIELQIRRTISGGGTFTPSGLVVSMENEWSTMSLEVQRAFGGVFSRSVQLQEDDTSRTIEVENIHTLSRYTNVALLLNRCPAPLSSPAAAAHTIRMPTDVPVGEDDNTCTVRDITKRISGWNGLCVDVTDGSNHDGNPIRTWPCGEQSNQQWTLHTDGTIRSLDKCMTASGHVSGQYVMIYNCSTVFSDATKWVVSIDGSITNPRSGLVLTAPAATPGTTLLAMNNAYAASQVWSVGNSVEPLVTYIVANTGLCLQVNNEKTAVWLEECVVDRQQQRWALYGDGTIRVDSDRSRCMTSDGYSSGALITIFNCQGWNNQRWVFNSTDVTILNPYAKLVMDGRDRNVTLRQMALFNPFQQWLTPVRI